MGHLAAEDGEFLAQDQQLEVLRARRPASEEEEEPEHLAEGERDEADGHRSIVASASSRMLLLVWQPTGRWHPSGESSVALMMAMFSDWQAPD